jgi:hypothetical protein
MMSTLVGTFLSPDPGYCAQQNPNHHLQVHRRYLGEPERQLYRRELRVRSFPLWPAEC